MQRIDSIHDKAVGRWRNLLPMLGVPERFLSRRHGPCPMCEGKDRFRWDDKDGRGTYYCNQCGAGTGVDLVMKVKGLSFIEAVRIIETQLPNAKPELRAQKRQREDKDAVAMKAWRAGHPLDGRDPVSAYLASRGLGDVRSPSLRYRPDAAYRHDDESMTQHPAMVALFQAADKSACTVQHTYLTDDGKKAEGLTARKLAPCPVPVGGAVRLMPAAKTLGIAEGVETALSAAKLFDVPVWAALTAGNLARWEPPPGLDAVLIFGDNDASYTGQAAAYELGKRLSLRRLHVEVRLPDMEGDWNDVHMMGLR